MVYEGKNIYNTFQRTVFKLVKEKNIRLFGWETHSWALGNHQPLAGLKSGDIGNPELPSSHRYTGCTTTHRVIPLREIQELADSYALSTWENMHIERGRKGWDALLPYTPTLAQCHTTRKERNPQLSSSPGGVKSLVGTFSGPTFKFPPQEQAPKLPISER